MITSLIVFSLMYNETLGLFGLLIDASRKLESITV